MIGKLASYAVVGLVQTVVILILARPCSRFAWAWRSCGWGALILGVVFPETRGSVFLPRLLWRSRAGVSRYRRTLG